MYPKENNILPNLRLQKENHKQSAWRALYNVFNGKLNLKCNNVQRKLNVKLINLQQSKHRTKDRKLSYLGRMLCFPTQ
jgi:hypothetical protein